MFELFYWLSIAFVLIGAILAMIAIWWKDFWRREISNKLLQTDGVLAVTSIIVAVIIKFLSE